MNSSSIRIINILDSLKGDIDIARLRGDREEPRMSFTESFNKLSAFTESFNKLSANITFTAGAIAGLEKKIAKSMIANSILEYIPAPGPYYEDYLYEYSNSSMDGYTASEPNHAYFPDVVPLGSGGYVDVAMPSNWYSYGTYTSLAEKDIGE